MNNKKYILLHPKAKKRENLPEIMTKHFNGDEYEVITLSQDEIDMVHMMIAPQYSEKEFWNPDNAYVLDQVAWDNLTKPISFTFKEKTP